MRSCLLRHTVTNCIGCSTERYGELTQSGKEKVISSLHALPKPKTGEEPERRLNSTQREWLTAIKDQPEAANWFAELSSDLALGSPTDHPDFLI